MSYSSQKKLLMRAQLLVGDDGTCCARQNADFYLDNHAKPFRGSRQQPQKIGETRQVKFRKMYFSFSGYIRPRGFLIS
jgi:hypothetical protein